MRFLAQGIDKTTLELKLPPFQRIFPEFTSLGYEPTEKLNEMEHLCPARAILFF